MRAWISLWMFPLGLLGAVVLVSVGSVAGALLALAWGFVFVPHVVKYALTHSREQGDAGEADEVDTHYWRITLS